MSNEPTPLASQLYAKANGTQCKGTDKCHWCGAPCERVWQHDDRPPLPFSRQKSLAKYPAHAYICVGCWLWRRRAITVNFLSEGYQDQQTPANHSWLITLSGCKAIRSLDHPQLLDRLLEPHPKFVLSLLDRPVATSGKPLATLNQLQYCEINWQEEVRFDTPLKFTINNVTYQYTVYELQKGLVAEEPNGTLPGVRELLRLFSGAIQQSTTALALIEKAKAKREEEENAKRGRPPALEDARQLKKKPAVR